MSEKGVACTNTLDRTTTRMFANQGYVVVQGLLDEAKDIQPVREEYGALLDTLATRWHADGELSCSYHDLPFEERLARIASEGVRYTDYFDICLTGNTGLMHRGPALFNRSGFNSPKLAS